MAWVWLVRFVLKIMYELDLKLNMVDIRSKYCGNIAYMWAYFCT